ncbi:predicted protein [Histoplasma capsulatum G186AR]|uniref:Uncharacterized protein n=1 Tax=Ajellomyces capsulatus (strain G186AR / H82 / ATCC MYA-2454 / RMSCC 2432) TaxID=447093 RepID=C0NXT8_AJECG|nr:uncharacterized protein HCBG_07732 [Histoplasma capsulatum G186AR]EEH03606.1 predicted protein [Histoplasma capsulatum G186AR]
MEEAAAAAAVAVPAIRAGEKCYSGTQPITAPCLPLQPSECVTARCPGYEINLSNNRSPQSLAELYRYIRLPLRGERYELGRRGIYGQVFSGAEGVVTEVLVPLQNGHAVPYP